MSYSSLGHREMLKYIMCACQGISEVIGLRFEVLRGVSFRVALGDAGAGVPGAALCPACAGGEDRHS